jgi:hypothetical protein
MNNRRVRFVLLLITLISLILLAASTPNKSNPNPWRGKWWSIDQDNSLQSIVFHGGYNSGGSVGFNYIDRGASMCGLDELGVPIFKADARGSGTVSGNTFTGQGNIRCLAKPPYIGLENRTFVWTYDPATNSISDRHNNTYIRSKP